MADAHSTCPLCQRELSSLEFSTRGRKALDGRPYCRACLPIIVRAVARAGDRRRRRLGLAVKSKARGDRRYNPQHAARKKLQNALITHRIAKPSECRRCGKPTTVLHAHHPDYTKPLDVSWLCTACHGSEHRLDSPEVQAEAERILAARFGSTEGLEL